MDKNSWAYSFVFISQFPKQFTWFKNIKECQFSFFAQPNVWPHLLELNGKHGLSSSASCAGVSSLEQMLLPVSRESTGVSLDRCGGLCVNGYRISYPTRVNYYETRSFWNQTSGHTFHGSAVWNCMVLSWGGCQHSPHRRWQRQRGRTWHWTSMCVFIPHSPVAIFSYPWHEEQVGTDVSMVYISAHIHWASCFPTFPPADDKESVQFSSVAQSCPTLCNPMNHSTPGLPVHHQLPEFTQTHVHWVSDAIQPSHLLSSPSPPAPKPSQHQSLFQWVNSSHEVAKVLEFQL